MTPSPFAIHAAVNEVPAVVMGVALCAMLFGWLRNSRKLRLLAYVAFVVCGVLVIVVASAGEHAILTMPARTMPNNLLGTHQYVASLALGSTELCLVLAVLTAVFESANRFYRYAAPALIGASLVALSAMLLTLTFGKAMIN